MLKNSKNNKKKITIYDITDIILKKWWYLITISILIVITLPFLSIFNIIDFNFIGRTYIIILFTIMIIYVILNLKENPNEKQIDNEEFKKQ